jgi:hypothetical protein
MSDTHVNHYTLDMENFSLDFVPIPEGISKIKYLMEHFVKMYPSFRQTPEFIRFKDEPNIVARAMMLTPDSPSEIFFVSIREKDSDGERQDMFFRTKYFNEITEYVKKNKAKEVPVDS